MDVHTQLQSGHAHLRALQGIYNVPTNTRSAHSLKIDFYSRKDEKKEKRMNEWMNEPEEMKK